MGFLARKRPPTRELVIWHNPRCTKSRQTLALLRDRGLSPRVVEYLKDPPDAGEIERVLGLLGMEPRQLMRKKEAPYASLDLGSEAHGRAALVRAMAENPILIERPVVLYGDRAALGRPPENALSVLDDR